MNYQKEVKAISAKGLTKDLINKYNILNGAEIFQNYLVFIPAKSYVRYFSETTQRKFVRSNGISEENIENITHTAILQQLLLISICYQTQILIDTA